MKIIIIFLFLVLSAITIEAQPLLFGTDGTYLGRLSANPYDPDSTSNPYGQYGSPYSSDSINNPYGTYGSPYSLQSPNNPYAIGGGGPDLAPKPSKPWNRWDD